MDYVTSEIRPDLGGNMRHGDTYTHCPTLWGWLIDRYAIRTMLDVGAGEGHACRYFQRAGVQAHGIDGLVANVLGGVHPLAHHDLTAGPYRMPVDLVWSCEVAEHIEAKFVHNYLETLMNGRVIAMTHAFPGQPGHHHVNCQEPGYWISALDERGYQLSTDNELLRKIAASGLPNWNHFSRSGLLFTRR